MKKHDRAAEIIAFFSNEKKLSAAISELEGSGIVRAAISMLTREGFEAAGKTTRNPDHISASQTGSVVDETDVRQVRTLASSMAAAAAIGGVVAIAGPAALVAVGGIAAIGGAAAIASGVGKKLGDDHQAFIREQIDSGGVVIWVNPPDEDALPRVVGILDRNGAVRIDSQ